MATDSAKYGYCSKCNVPFIPIWFTEHQYNKHNQQTGKTRRNIDYLICPCCLKKEAVDDSFATEWK